MFSARFVDIECVVASSLVVNCLKVSAGERFARNQPENFGNRESCLTRF